MILSIIPGVSLLESYFEDIDLIGDTERLLSKGKERPESLKVLNHLKGQLFLSSTGVVGPVVTRKLGYR